MGNGVNGNHSVHAVKHAALLINQEKEHAQIRHRNMVVRPVMDQIQ